MQIVNESYAAESHLTNSLLKDLEKPKNQEAIALLPGMPESIETVQKNLDAFESSALAYKKIKGKEDAYENATSIKKKTIKLINDKFIMYLKTMSMVNEPVYGELSRTVSQIIDDNNETIKRRSKKKLEEVG